jgi:uncharacterized RDD family membrane protein YckC
MPSPSSFLATPGKRVAAAVFDLFAVVLIFLILAAAAELTGSDIGSFRTFLLVALVYHAASCMTLDGQTFGKRAQGICLVTSSGKAVSTHAAIVRASVRYLPPMLLTVNYVEWDLMEGIVAFAARVGVGLLFIAEVALLQRPPAQQTLADRAARTLVVNTPEVQPHRAPAIPMYSATDAEFGSPPKAGKEG